MSQSQKDKFRDLLSDFDTAVLITHAAGNCLRARPMAIAAVDQNCDLWFITGRDSAKAHEIEQNTRVHVVCQNGWKSCLSLSGRASLCCDPLKTRALWKSSYQAWFPLGVDDPDIGLIHVIGEQGEYWDNTGLKQFTYAYQTVKAIVTGTTPQVREGEQHGHVELAGKSAK
jgi:general stress protein 26